MMMSKSDIAIKIYSLYKTCINEKWLHNPKSFRLIDIFKLTQFWASDNKLNILIIISVGSQNILGKFIKLILCHRLYL